MSYATWLSLGLILAISEFVVPGFVIIFFGFGALFVGVLVWMFPALSEMAQLLLLPLSSLVALALFRRFFVKSVAKVGTETGTNFDDNDCVGRVVKVVVAIEPGTDGKVELNGVNWSASCEAPVAVGRNVRILSRSGLTLCVVPA